MNGTNKLESGILTLSWKGLAVANTPAYWIISKLRIKESVVNMAPVYYYYFNKYITYVRAKNISLFT